MKIYEFYSLVFSALLATACINAHTANPCIFTPYSQDGIAGTGQKLAVVGVVTGFASICVNGE